VQQFFTILNEVVDNLKARRAATQAVMTVSEEVFYSSMSFKKMTLAQAGGLRIAFKWLTTI